MVHPIYKYAAKSHIELAEVLSKAGDNEAFPSHLERKIDMEIDLLRRELNTGEGESLKAFTMLRVTMMSKIIKTGLVLIDASSDEWYSSISRKVIASMSVDNFKIPFSAGTMVMHNGTYNFYKDDHGIMVAMLSDNALENMHITEENFDPEEKITTEVFTLLDLRKEHGETIGEIISNNYPGLPEEKEAEMYAFLSAMMYVTMANGSTTYDDTIKRKKVLAKAKRKQGIPRHVTNYINVRQRSAKGSGPSTERDKSQKFWVVRGHWRNQWYAKDGVNKPKWIDSHFKGSGKELADKVYKI